MSQTMTGRNFNHALKLLMHLEDCRRQGLGDSIQADALRDRLDAYYGWCASTVDTMLSEKERQILNDVSAALQGAHEIK